MFVFTVIIYFVSVTRVKKKLKHVSNLNFQRLNFKGFFSSICQKYRLKVKVQYKKSDCAAQNCTHTNAHTSIPSVHVRQALQRLRNRLQTVGYTDQRVPHP